MNYRSNNIKNLVLILTGILLFAIPVQAQPDSVKITCILNQSGFREFAEAIESQTECRFFYQQTWVENVRVTYTGEEVPLRDVLEEVMREVNLNYTVDRQLNIIISGEDEYLTGLPETFAPSDELSESFANGKQLTETEKRYISGRKTAEAETLTIGIEQSSRSGRNVIIDGKMSDIETGEPLIGATIYIEELKSGSVSDVVGHYSIVIQPGRYSAVFNCLGMKEQRYFLRVWSDARLDISLQKELIPINEVTIKADRYHNVTGMQMGFERLDIKSIKEIPVVMGERDLLKVAQMLPGVQNVGEGSAGFNVRGSPADQNLFYINKVPVYNPSHLFGFFSSFSPDIVKDFRLYKSNIPAEYGGRLASYFDISTRDGNRNKFSMRGGISPITGHVAVEGPIKKDHTSFMLGVRSTYSDWILKRLDNPELRNSNAMFYDIAGNVTIEPNPKNRVKVFGYHSSDRFSLSTTNDYQYSNSGGSVDWRHRFSSALSGDFAAIAGRYAFQTADYTYPSAGYQHKYKIDQYEAKANMRWIAGPKQIVSFGMNLINYRLDRGDILPAGAESSRVPVQLGTESGIESAIYIADEYKLYPWLTLYGGLRYSLYSYMGPATVYEYYPDAPKIPASISDTLTFGSGPVKTYSGPELRAAMNFRTGGNSSFKLSYNRVRQYLFMLSNTISIAPADQWKLTDYHIRPPYLDQYSAGYYKDFPRRGISTSIEVYYKRTYDNIEYKDGANFISSPQIETEILQGDQQAYGIELLLKKNLGKLNGWIAYTYSRAEVRVDGDYPWEQINFGEPYPANYDKPHALNIVANLRLNRRFSLSSNLVYSTGRPVTYPISLYYYDNKEIVDYSLRNKYRLPDYFRMDFSMNIEGNLKAKKLAHSYWMLSIYNLTGRKNAYSVYFLSEEGSINGYKLSIFGTQIFTISWNFRFGNYASE
jgi:hypothetical protein